jgi:hypothetical protein
MNGSEKEPAAKIPFLGEGTSLVLAFHSDGCINIR